MNEPKRYVEEPKRSFLGVLSDREYARAMQALILVCTDFVPVDRARRTMYLAKRVVQSAEGMWRFGGRQRSGETTRESCVRLAKRELNLTLASDRLQYVMTVEDLFAWREQVPQDLGAHYLTHVFSVECTPEELDHAARHLDPNEYDTEFGIRPFTREQLVAEGLRLQLLDTYDAIFPRA